MLSAPMTWTQASVTAANNGRAMDMQPTTEQLKAAWRRGQLAARGISYDAAMAIPYLRAALIGTVRAMQKTAARHARATLRAPYHD